MDHNQVNRGDEINLPSAETNTVSKKLPCINLFDHAIINLHTKHSKLPIEIVVGYYINLKDYRC